MEGVLSCQKLLLAGLLADLDALGEMLVTAGVEASKISLVLQINIRSRCLLLRHTRTCCIGLDRRSSN